MSLNKETNKQTTKPATQKETKYIPKKRKSSLNPVIKSYCPVRGKGWGVNWDTIISYLNDSIQRIISYESLIYMIYVSSFKYNKKTTAF